MWTELKGLIAGRAGAYLSGKGVLADLVALLFAAAWLVLTALAVMTVLMLLPGLSAAATGWTMLAIAAVAALGYFIYGRSLVRGLAPRGLATAALQLLALALGARLIMWGAHRVQHARFDSFRAGLKAQGLPMSVAEFQESYPDQDYAYPALTQALTKFDAKFLNSKPRPGASGVKRWDAGIRKDTHEVAAHYEAVVSRDILPILARQRRFVKVDYLALARDPAHPARLRIAPLIGVGSAIRLSALDMAEQGRMSQAWERLDILFSLADMMAQDRTLLGKMYVLALRRMGAQAALTAMLNHPGLTMPRAIADRLASLQGGRLVQDAAQAELALAFDSRDVCEPLWARGNTHCDFFGLPDPSQPADRATAWVYRLAAWTGAFDSSCLRWAQYLTQVERENSAAVDGLFPESKWADYFAPVFTPHYFGMGRKERECQAWARLALLMSAAGQYRAGSGRYPRSLDALSPRWLAAEHLADPVTGKPFDYEAAPDGRGFTLCSLGAKGDRKDSRGDEFCVRRKP
jgi:hypothetical protein